MILTVESENECQATNSEESMCERVNMYGWPGDQVSFLQLVLVLVLVLVHVVLT